jgi:hypothetical protein
MAVPFMWRIMVSKQVKALAKFRHEFLKKIAE